MRDSYQHFFLHIIVAIIVEIVESINVNKKKKYLKKFN